MTSGDWSGRPPGGTESNINLYESPNHLKPDDSGYLHAMTMDDINKMQKSNNVSLAYLINWMIDQATNTLSNHAKAFNKTE